MNNQQLIESLDHHLYKLCEIKDYSKIIQDIKSSKDLTPQEKAIAIRKALKAQQKELELELDFSLARFKAQNKK